MHKRLFGTSLLVLAFFIPQPSSSANEVNCVDHVLNAAFSEHAATPLSHEIPFPETKAQVNALMKSLEPSNYANVIRDWRARGGPLSESETERLWRMAKKSDWRVADATPETAAAERRIKMLTNRERKAHDFGGMDESADPASPFELTADLNHPKGMPTGSYNLSSGKTGFFYSNTEKLLRNEHPAPFEIEFQQLTHDGKVVTQKGGYAAQDSSWGWDGRFELQPNGKGGHELIITQGSMELPVNLKNADADASLWPHVSVHNEYRSRHLYTLEEWKPAHGDQPAKLVVRDRGSILDMKPENQRRWIQIDEQGKLAHAHGYGENFVPDEHDSRKLWIDAEGYPVRIFDMVTKETTIEETLKDGHKVVRHVPTETKAVLARMDPKNPSKLAPDQPFSFLTSNQIPGSDRPLPATVRHTFNTSGHAVETREILSDRSVKIVRGEHVPQNAPALLNEGLNIADKPVGKGKDRMWIATNSGGEYTSGGLPRDEETFYGTYLWYRKMNEGMGPFTPVMNSSHTDLEDMFRDLTQMYGGSWGIGRAQIFEKDGKLWAKAHMVDVDLLPDDAHRFPHAGFPPEAEVFADGFRRHQVLLPVKVEVQNGVPHLLVDDPNVAADLKAWKKRMKREQPQAD